MSADRSRGRWQLLGLALLFFGPLLIAWWLYLGPGDWRPERTTTHGELLDPPVSLPSVSLQTVNGQATGEGFLQGHWTLLYVGAGECAARCRAALIDTRQIRLALGRNAERVQRVFLFAGTCCDRAFLEREHPDLITAWADEIDGRQLLDRFPDSRNVMGAGRIYVVDPLGNLILSYGPQIDAEGILEDLKRLLRLSRVG